MNASAVRIVIVDDHPVMRDGLVAWLSHEKRIEVVGTAADGRSGVALVFELRPDIVLMDVSMSGLNGIAATRQITSSSATNVICLTMHIEHFFIKQMLSAGASGYVVKASDATELIEAILQVAAGGTYFSACVADALAAFDSAEDPEPHAEGCKGITPREREVLQLIAEGCDTKDIADQLQVSAKTVLAHRENLMRKLKVNSPVALALHAYREGIAEV
jgi:DNA-binding NarL/FixJ family response regulator